jgi:hypothetical protein
MEEIVNLIATDSSASDVSDRIKDILYTKASEKIEKSRSTVASSMFSDTQSSEDSE